MKAPAPKKSLGQHFITDPNILRRIVAGSGVRAGDRVLEIGPGLGSLTRALLNAGARLWAIEADSRMVEYLESLGLKELHLRVADALETDYLGLAEEAGAPLRLVANLPYNISGPLIVRLLQQRKAFVSMTVMLQRDVAERLLALPGHRTRGALSVLVQTFCSAQALFRLGPGAFRPAPKVESAVIRLDVLAEPVAPLEDEELLRKLVRGAFGKRRKMLRNSLRGICIELDALLREAGLQGTERPEELPATAWIALANGLARLWGCGEGDTAEHSGKLKGLGRGSA
jgi:16S rRNA (adenine1518-N6/adenine1519-N6)-dimethyltransferase